MKNRISEQIRVQHMLDAVRQIQEFTAETTYDQYQQDLKLRLALTRLIEIIGEASNHISEETKALFTDIEWTVLYGIRHILVHDYFGLDYEIIWQIITLHLPQLRQSLDIILDNEPPGGADLEPV